MAKQKEAWDKLSMQEKALLIKLSVDNGVSSLKLIRDTYNLYSSGGKKQSAEMRGDTVRVPSLEDAIKFTETYKQYYPLNNGGALAHKYDGKLVGLSQELQRIPEVSIIEEPWADAWFKDNKNVAGMAIGKGLNGVDGDRRVIINPYNTQMNDSTSRASVLLNERLRHVMDQENFSLPNITKELMQKYEGTSYLGDTLNIGRTEAARYLSGDPSHNLTNNLRLYIDSLKLNHKKSGKELGETSRLNNGYNSSEDWLLLMKMKTNQMLQNVLNSPFYMTDLEMLNLEFARMQEAMNNNPSSEFITYTGFDNNGNEITKRLPAAKGLNTMMDAGVVDYMPTLGDAKLAVEAVVAAKQGDYLTAGLLGGMMFLPNIIEKPLKKWKKVRNLTKELKERPLQQVIDDEEINAWLAENWYKNEIHNARPVLKSRTVSIDDFDKNGMPLHYKLEDDLPTLKRGDDNILIHVDNRLPLLAGRKGFLPLDGYTGDSPAIWWQRDYPYYTEPSSLSFSGHTLKVKEGDVIPLEPLRRYPNSPGPVVVTEGVLPYNILEGYKWNSDLSWFERERFAPSKSILDYFKYNNLPEWFTYSTGGPLYPFSFEKNPFLKTPIVRY